jgi:hypothetical protein
MAMTAGQREENAELVREIVRDALDDAMEILVIISLMECQNTGGVNDRLSHKGAAPAGIVLRNALKTHLVTTITRAYSESRVGDLHFRRAFEILRDSHEIRAEFQVEGSNEGLHDAESYFLKCCGDHRLKLIKQFRHKIVAHRGKLEDISKPKYEELFAFAYATIEAIEKLALAIRITRERVKDNSDAGLTAEAFWHPWKIGAKSGGDFIRR